MLHEAEQVLEDALARSPRSWFLWNVRFQYFAFGGQYAAAAKHLQAEEIMPWGLRDDALAKRMRLVRALKHSRPDDITASRAAYLAEALEQPSHVRNAALALAALRARNDLLELLHGYLLGRGRYASPIGAYTRRPTYFLFLPSFEPFWSDPAFVELMSEVGLS